MEHTDIFEGISRRPLYELQPGVKTAIISANDIASTNIMAFQEILLQIEHLKLEGRVHNKKPDSFAEFFNKILMNPASKLRTLFLYEVWISPEETKLLSTALVSNTTLESLYLTFNQIGDDGARSLASAFEKNTTWRLQSLSLSLSLPLYLLLL